MFSKYVLILSALFSFSVMTAQADMSGEEASGFNGAFELKYKSDLGNEGVKIGDLTYRARLGWAGEVNNMMKWKVALSTSLNEKFNNLLFSGISLEQAYAVYMPLDGLKIRVGKYAWNKKFAYSSVLYDDDIYAEGVNVKYHDNMLYAKASITNIAGTVKNPSTSSAFYGGKLLTIAKVGMKPMDVGVGSASAYVGAHYGGLLDTDSNSKTLVNAGLKVKVSDIAPVPMSLVANYSRSIDDTELSDLSEDTYTVTLNAHSDIVEASVSYYNVNPDSWNSIFLDGDYVNGKTALKGVAVNLSREVWENSELEVKYTYNLNAQNSPNNLVAELTFKL